MVTRRSLWAAVGVAAIAFCLVAQTRKRFRKAAPVVVTELWVYPVKGCRGSRVTVARLNDKGVEYDREWFVAKAADGIPLKQSNIQRLTLIATYLDCDAGTLTLSADGFGSVTVPLAAPDAVRLANALPFDLWGMGGGCIDEGDAAAEFLANATGVAGLRLRRVVAARDAKLNDDMPHLPAFPTPLSAHDESSLMLMSRATVAQVALASGDATVDVTRFRPNIVVDGVGAREEDSFSEMVVNNVRLETGRLCTRCSVPCVRADGTMHPTMEPARTLRRRWAVSTAPGSAPRPVCGLSVFHTMLGGALTGVIRVGDELTVTASHASPQYTATAATV